MFIRVEVSIYSAEIENLSLKNSRSDEAFENGLNDDLIDLAIMLKIE